MAATRVILRYTTGHDTSSSPLATHEHTLPIADGDDSNVTRIVSTEPGIVFKQLFSDDHVEENGIVLAHISTNCFLYQSELTNIA